MNKTFVVVATAALCAIFTCRSDASLVLRLDSFDLAGNSTGSFTINGGFDPAQNTSRAIFTGIIGNAAGWFDLSITAIADYDEVSLRILDGNIAGLGRLQVVAYDDMFNNGGGTFDFDQRITGDFQSDTYFLGGSMQVEGNAQNNFGPHGPGFFVDTSVDPVIVGNSDFQMTLGFEVKHDFEMGSDVTARGALKAYSGGGTGGIPEPSTIVVWATLATLGLVVARRVRFGVRQ